MSINKRIDQARDAYQKRDLKASEKAHSRKAIAEARERHGATSHQYIGDMVYGGLDGIITTFAVVSGVAGASLGSGIVLILGLANLFADGLSMATGAYLSSKSEREYYDRERERELWEIEHFPEGERLEMVEIYQEKGYSAEDAQTLIDIHSEHEDLWLEEMMVQELGMLPDERKPILSAAATLVAFIIAGAVPLLVYLLGLVVTIPTDLAFPTAIGLSGLAMFGLGAAKVFITERNWLRGGLEMLVVGGLAASVAYIVGYLLRGLGA
ncbi:MAG: VIT1/CCC1 transporter family protein [Anaerolineae bacterium]|nr:VIT1/CCC1 transporter family protein [Anaerolineae bacterium]